MDITALFDDADAAEHALVNLQALGIHPSRYKIMALRVHQDAERAWAAFGNTTGIPGTGMTAAAGTGFSPAGGPGFAVTGLSHDAPPFARAEQPSREVRLLVTVADSEARRTQSALISNHGRQVRQATP